MSIWRLAIASLRHFWRTNFALLLGIAIGTAVLTGALIVGDSIRGSLKALTIERLGRIDEILIGEQFFRRELADDLNAKIADGLDSTFAQALPAILVNQATVETTSKETTSRSQGVTVVGCTPDFWKMDTTGLSPKIPEEGQIVVNQSLADELGAQIGDILLIRVGKPTAIAADSPLARKDDLVKTVVDLELVDIVPTSGLGRFSMQASQQVPANAFVDLETLQDGIDQDDKINAILVAGSVTEQVASDASFNALQQALAPTMEDLGLKLKRISLDWVDDGEPKTVFRYDALTNDRMLFDPEHNPAVEEALAQWNAQPVFTYLATKMQRVDGDNQPVGEIAPYSTITAIDSTFDMGPILDDEGKPVHIEDGKIVLNAWTAQDLGASIGDSIRITWFEPETTHGEIVEHSQDFELQFIAPMAEPWRRFSRRRAAQYDTPPTLVNDPDLTAEVEGITDAESMSSWDAPFPMDSSLLRRRDDTYWENYRTTPKAFVSMKTGKELWHSRFGTTTSYRIPADDASVDEKRSQLSAQLSSDYEAFGMHWMRAKRDGLAASKGTTPFDALFFGFSQFIIAAALMLVSLLLRLGLEQRATQLGLVGALGFGRSRTIRLMLSENFVIVLLGAAVGVLIGIAYAWLMLVGLRTWWVAAVVTPFMRLEVTPRALMIGFMLGTIASLLTILVTLRRLRKLSLSRLMSGKTEEDLNAAAKSSRRSWAWLPWVFLLMAVGLGAYAPSLPPEPQGGAFFGSGACVLIALLVWVTQWLKRQATHAADGASLNLGTLAVRNLTRNPTRSTLTIGLVAAACFLIVAISAFRLSPTEGGTGGFELVGSSDQPIFDRPEVGRVFPLRLQDGDDASCRNLYQSSKPQIIGITEDFIASADEIGKMDWAGVAEGVADDATNWSVLSQASPLGGESDAIPVVLDKNTAMYSMQIYTGVGTEFERDYGAAGKLKFRIVGLLSGSIFQGSLLIPEEELLEHFPRVGGYRFFLVDTAEEDASSVSSQLEATFSDEGLDLTDTNRLLTELLAVQNTYLSTFQSLGGLGLLLGTFGLAAVQLRNVVQRRGELALLRATGLQKSQLAGLVLREHALLLFGGLAVGTLAALVVVFPHMVFGGATVPLGSLLTTLGLVAVVGLASGFFAQRYLQSMPLLGSLRGD